MTALENKQLLNLIRYAPVVIVSVFALAVNLIAIQDKRVQADQSIKNLREELILQQKEMILSEVSQVYKHIILQRHKIENDLKENAKQRVYEAYGIANYIFAQNIDKPKAEVGKLITEALRPIRFFGGRGYFFILDSDGTTILNAANPYMEGKINLDIHDDSGNLTFRKMLDITNDKSEGYLNWRFKKPGQAGSSEFEKIGFIKRFEPFGWSIGTGEYFADFEKSVKEGLLNWFSGYEYGEGGYFFVLDKQGTLLAHHRDDFVGLNMDVGKPLGNEFFQKIMDQIRNGSGYVRSSKPLTLSGDVALEQVSYFKEIKEWGWIIGTGFSTQSFERRLQKKEEALVSSNRQSLNQLISLSIASMLLLTGCSWYVGLLIARRFEMFKRKMEEDFNELNDTKNKMEYMALHDALTNLPNHFLMLEEIKKGIELSHSANNKLAVMFVDLDNFKNVNDLYGHQVGDQLLEVISRKFELLTDTNGSLSRFGGDEFMFCYSNLKDVSEAKNKVALIHEALSSPFEIEGRSLCIGCSVGVSMFPDDSLDPEILISQADTVLYQSKAEKKGQSLFYSSAINEQIQRKAEIERELAHAIKNNGLSVYYQPQANASDETRILSVEVLARWKHPSLGCVFPDEFIAVAEERGLINDLGLFVFRRACEDIYALSANGKDALKLSVNISPIQLMEPDLCLRLIEICAEIGIAPQRITLEITENIFINSFEAVQPLLTQLREQGFGLSLDDFGTGYSSLSYINGLPLTEIKIDRSFISKFLDNYQSDMLVRMIIEIGRLYGLVVVAEGVETHSQLQKLIIYKCDLVQGFYLDKPLEIERLAEKFFNQSEKGVSNTHISQL